MISPSIRTRSELNELSVRLTDLTTDPRAVLGPEATVIPVAEILKTTGQPDYARVLIDTTTGTHRIKSWTKPPIVITTDGVTTPRRLPSIGAAAVDDFIVRVSEHRFGRPTNEQADSTATASPDQWNSAVDQHRDLAFVPRGAIADFIQILLVSLVIGAALFFLGLPLWTIIVFGFLSVLTLPKSIPAPIIIGHHGIVWGRWTGKRFIPWEAITQIEAVETGFGRPRIVWVDATTGNRAPIPVTKFMSASRAAELAGAVSTYRPFINR